MSGRLVPDDDGEQPDYRFTLANERTFLAYVRTALALNAGGLAVAIVAGGDVEGGGVLAVALILAALLVTVLAHRRWVRTEEAMRRDRPLPPTSLPVVLLGAVGVLSVIMLVVVALAAR